jgi:hypothetical protein
MGSRDVVSDYYERLDNDRRFVDQLQKMDDDTDDALKQWKTQMGDKGRAGFPEDFLSDYESAGDGLDKKRDIFNRMKTDGEAPPNRLISAFDDWWSNLQLLQAENARAEALLELDVASRAADETAVSVELAKLGRSQILSSLRQQLKHLNEELEDAQKDQEMLPLKAILKLMVEVCAGALTTAEALPAAVVAAGAVTAAVAIDYVYGDSGAKSAVGNAAKAADKIVDLDEAVEEIRKEAGAGGEKLAARAAKFLAEAAPKVVDAASDYAEADSANQKVERLQGMIADTLATYKRFRAEADPISEELRGLQKKLDRLFQDVKKAMTKSDDAAKKYKSIKDKLRA